MPFQKYSKVKLVQFFSGIIDKCGFKKLRILSLVHANFRIQDDEDYNALFAWLLELMFCLQPFTFPLLLNNNICSSVEQIAQRMMVIFGSLSPSIARRIDMLDFQSFFQRFLDSSPHERQNAIMLDMRDFCVSVFPEDNEWRLFVDKILSILCSKEKLQSFNMAMNDIHRSSGSQLNLMFRGVFVYTQWVDTK